jgi:predicted ATPase
MDNSSTRFDSAPYGFDDVLWRFEVAWQGLVRPQIRAYLPAGSGHTRLLTELVHLDLEYRLRAGEAARVEDYLTPYPELADDHAATLELIAAEFALRRRYEPGLTATDYVRRFPQYGQELADKIIAATLISGVSRDVPRRVAFSPRDEHPAVPGYEVVGLLGRGGMGVVYTARQLSLDRNVALKFLPGECARYPAWLERFRREALTASALNHPHICTIYDSGECAGRPFLSMELVEGRTLAALVRDRPAIDDLARLIGQAARALAAAHAAGVVHRDIKPQNVMVRPDGIVKVLDFGLARRLSADAAADPAPGTDPGTRVGTVSYMSPEQTRGEPADTASDIFSLGIVLYELATGQHPFAAFTEAAIAQAIIEQRPLPIVRLNPEAPAALDVLVQHMLVKDPRLRPTAAEVDAELAELSGKKNGGQPSGLRHCPARLVTVGREAEGAALRSGFESAAAGRGLFVCVTGEPGLGKTTLVEDFVNELAAGDRPHSLARGRCSERLAGTEAYLPFLEALDSLIQGTGGSAVAQMMKLVAPSWYVQLVPLAAEDTALARVLQEAKVASQERRKRELGVLLDEVSRRRPLVIFLDDVHWADPSSVDLLAYLGTRCAGLSLLLVLTYRPSDLALSRHPFGPVKLDLQGRGVCREIALPFLKREDFDRYLALAFAGHAFPPELASVLHARTEGNPLFMVDLLRYLRDRGAIVQEQGHWVLVRAVPDLLGELPESVRGMIQRKADQLSAADRHLLMAASVQGPEFDSAVVAQVLGREPADVEERLDVLGRVHHLVRLVRDQSFPDGALSVRYGFVHVLYQNALYAALQPTRKAAWSLVAAQALLRHHGDKSAGLAADLAMLFEAGRDPEQAADHYRVAAQNAARLFAHHEAVALTRRGLALVQTLPDTPDRARLELPLQMTLGVQLQVTHGYAAAEAERTYARARALCEQVQEAPPLFLVLWGLWMFYVVRSDLRKSSELAERLFKMAERAADPTLLLEARLALAVTSLSLGDSSATHEYMLQGIALYDQSKHSSYTDLYGQDPGVSCLAFGAVALWLLGYPDRAVERSREAVTLGRELGHPTTRALTLHFASMLRQYRREGAAVQESAEAATAIATEHGLSLWLAIGQFMRGWALTEQGAGASGIAELRQGMAGFAATGAEIYRTYFLALLAEALGREGKTEEGLRLLDEALVQMQRTGEVFHEAELHRLRGEFLLRREAPEAAYGEAEDCFRQALTIARRQGARSLELRAAMSLTRLYQKRDRAVDARPTLAACYEWFTEGLDTPDLHEAKSLLEQVS